MNNERDSHGSRCPRCGCSLANAGAVDAPDELRMAGCVPVVSGPEQTCAACGTTFRVVRVY